ncbi:MAG: ATP-binding protein [Magnetovibrio sp.]|nr:ATP-binding protein [Magnetovibrio sp.]
MDSAKNIRTVISVGLLSILGLLGNMVSVPMFFGVDQIFGSVFVLISAVLYGPIGGLISGTIAHAYTIVLWNHPYAFIAFVTEAVLVGYLCYNRRLPLFVASLLFWGFIGIPMAWVFYRHALGLEETQSLIIALKQPANGLSNSLVSSLLLLFLPIRRWFKGDDSLILVSFRDMLLTVIMSFVFFSSFVTVQINARKTLEESQNQVFNELKIHEHHLHDLLTAALYQERIEGKSPFVHSPHETLDEATCAKQLPLAGNAKSGIVLTNRGPSSCLSRTIPIEDFTNYLSKTISDQDFRLSVYDADGHPLFGFPERTQTKTLTERFAGTLNPLPGDMYQELGASPEKPLMLQWKLSTVMHADTFDDLTPWVFVIELPFAKYVDRLQQSYISSFAIILSVTFGAFIVVTIIRNRLTRDLTNLMATTVRLPERIKSGKHISLPQAQITEVYEIGNNIIDVANALSAMIEEMRIQNDNLMNEVQEREKAETASKAKSEFLSMVSHELRTPLTSILGSLGLLENTTNGKLGKDEEHLFSVAVQNTKRLNALVDDLLDLEKIQSGQLKITQDTVDVSELVSQAVEANNGYANKLGIQLNIVGEQPAVAVIGDKGRLLQVLANFISNASKFSPNEGVVSIAWDVLIEDGTDNRTVRISVSDDGPGIPEEFHSKLFVPFEQADSSSTRNISGTGLGLSICKIIADRHNGDISFSTKEGVGTTFYLTLPAKPVT